MDLWIRHENRITIAIRRSTETEKKTELQPLQSYSDGDGFLWLLNKYFPTGQTIGKKKIVNGFWNRRDLVGTVLAYKTKYPSSKPRLNVFNKKKKTIVTLNNLNSILLQRITIQKFLIERIMPRHPLLTQFNDNHEFLNVYKSFVRNEKKKKIIVL